MSYYVKLDQFKIIDFNLCSDENSGEASEEGSEDLSDDFEEAEVGEIELNPDLEYYDYLDGVDIIEPGEDDDDDDYYDDDDDGDDEEPDPDFVEAVFVEPSTIGKPVLNRTVRSFNLPLFYIFYKTIVYFIILTHFIVNFIINVL